MVAGIWARPDCTSGEGAPGVCQGRKQLCVSMTALVRADDDLCRVLQRNLESDFALVFVAEQLHELDLLALYGYVGLPMKDYRKGLKAFEENKSPMPPNAVTVTGSGGSAKVTDEQRRRIRELNELDIELHEFAASLHKRSIERLSSWMERNSKAAAKIS